MKKELIKYFKTLGIEVYTNTKARGHQGFYVRNRIDISKNTKEERVVPTLLHEFAHFVHEKLEPRMAKTGGSLEVLFGLETSLPANKMSEASQNTSQLGWLRQNCIFLRNDDGGSSEKSSVAIFEKELISVTNFVDDNSLFLKLELHKNQVKEKIKKLETVIKEDYPDFMRSKKFKQFDKYIKKSKAKYLLSYDRVKFVSRSMFSLLKKVEILSVDNIENDFPEMPPAFCAYIRLKSQQKKQAKISRRINQLKKYYSKPAELFARLVEGIYLDGETTQNLAPVSSRRFFELLEQGYYLELREVFQLLSGRKTETTEFSVKYLFAQS